VISDSELIGNAATSMLTAGPEGLSAWLVGVLLFSVRLIVAMALSPALSSYGLPMVVRVVLVFVLAALVQSAPNVSPHAIPGSPESFLLAVVAEVFLGMLLGLGVLIVFAAFAITGRMLDVQIGFGIGSVFDPVMRTNQNVMGSLLSLVGVTLFFATDAHLALAAMLASSTKVFPIGQFPAINNPFPLLSASGSMFAMGLALAAPVAVAMVLTDLFVGITLRNMPQMNVLVLSIPLKVLIAYFVLALSVRAWAPMTHRMFNVVGDVLGAH